ncbi:MAG: histidinol dehydrogenase [Bacteroidales bacterium]|nr:histidinol dehydrogenase [Bacteroidales bacterium]
MKTFYLPPRDKWEKLCLRPVLPKDEIENTVRDIIQKVKSEGDKALVYLNKIFGGTGTDTIRIDNAEISRSSEAIPERLKTAILLAKSNIEKFHSSQIISEGIVETMNGVRCWRKSVPIEKVGLYIPGGTAPLFSTLLMLAVPAKIAGCEKIIVCTPPDESGTVNPLILYTASICGVSDVFAVGGAQAIAAMAFGTETIPRVYKIFGPGNQYVTKAKEMVQTEGVAIDMPAGPSELLVIADETADPDFVAADLLSQAEHGSDSQVVLLTTSNKMLEMVRNAVDRQIQSLERKEKAQKSLENSLLIQFETTGDCIEFSNLYAPEHLIISTADALVIAKKVTSAGSVFIGRYSCESIGDYASGTNHTLPTNGYARSFSGVSTDSFMKKITFQEVSAEGLAGIGPAVETMAEAELLTGHRNAVTIRLNSLKND